MRIVGMLIVSAAVAGTAMSFQLPPPPVIEPAPPKTLFQMHRNRIAAGETGYVWSYEPRSMQPQLVGAGGVTEALATFRLGWPACDWELPYHCGFKIPANTPPGEYMIRIDQVTLSLEITAPVSRGEPIKVGPNATVDDIEQALSRGDVELSPVRYKLTRPLNWTKGRRMYFNDATFVRTKPNDYLNRVIVAADGMELIGPGAIENFDTMSIAIHTTGSAVDVLLDRITVRFGGFGYWDSRGLRMKDVTFDHCGITNLRWGLWTGCKFKGISRAPDQTASSFWTACSITSGGAVCLLDLDFESTPQGVRFEARDGPLEHAFVAGVRYRNIDSSNNQCELLSCEGTNQIRNVVYFHHRDSGCVGPAVNLWSGAIDGMLCRDGRSDSTVCIASADNSLQTRITFEDWQSGGFETRNQAVGNIFRRCGVFRKPSRENQFGDTRPFNPNKPAFRVGLNRIIDCWEK